MQVIVLRRLTRLILPMLLGCGATAFAQYSSSIQGTVSDSTGAMIPNAEVTLTSEATNATTHTRTTNSGVYRFNTLATGDYIIRVHMDGFTDTKTTVPVTPDEVAGVNVQLRAGSATSVEVTTEAPLLNPEETRTQYTLSEEELRNLPDQNSATLGFVRLAPGSTGVVEGLNNLNENRNLPEANANGLDSASNLYTLDNVPIVSSQNYASSFNGNVAGAIVFVPNLSAIGEVALQTTTFAVSYGTQASQIVAFNTKAGSSSWHGIFDESYGDRVLNAYSFDVVHSGAQHRHVYSGGIGGPIVKDHVFFWGAAEHRGEVGPSGGGAAQVFTPQFASLIGKPANDPNQISVTAFIRSAPNSRALFVPSPSDQTGAQYFGGCTGGATTTSYNVPCNLLVTENALEAGAHFLHGENYNGRLDTVFNGGKDRIYAFYYGSTQLSDSEAIAPAFDGYTPTHGKDASLNYTKTISPNLVNQATFGYWDFRFDFQTTPHSQQLVDLPFLFLNIGVLNFTRFVPFIDTEKQFYGRDTLLYQRGKHNFNFGVEAANNVSYDDRTGIYSRPLLYLWFSHNDFFDDKQDLIVVSNYYSGVTGQHIASISAAQNTRFGVYAQDSWKIRPNFTLTYGIRYDDLGNPQPTQNTIPFANTLNTFPSGIIRSQALVKGLRVGAQGSAYAKAQNVNFDPRIGFAWAPLGNDFTTVLRGGFGVYQDLPNLEIISGQVTSNPPGIIGFTGCCGGTVGYGTNQNASQGFGYTNIPTSVAKPVYMSNGSPGGNPTIQGVDPYLPPQRAMLWNLGLEHQFKSNLVAALTYTGSYSYNQVYSTDLNRPVGNATLNFQTNADTQNYVNNDFGGVSPYIAGLTSNANLLTAALRQNYRGVQMQASYTWEHILGTPDGFGQNGIVDSYNPNAQYGNAAFDVRNSFKVSAVTPIRAHFSNHILQTALNGFGIDNIFIGQTGEPFTVYYGNQTANTDFAASNKGFNIPNYSGPRSFSRKQWKNGIFPVANNPGGATPNAACGGLLGSCYVGFSRPTGIMGNEGENTFRNAGYFTWDANVQRRIDLPWFAEQKGHLTLRIDGFNIINRFNPSPIQLNNLGNPGGQQIDGGTGPVTTNGFQARTLQLGARFEF